MAQDPMTTLARQPDVAVVVIGGPESLVAATRKATTGMVGLVIVEAGMTEATAAAASRRPFALIMSDELYAFDDKGEFDALARDVGATVISTPTRGVPMAIMAEMIEPRLARAHVARYGPSALDSATVAVQLQDSEPPTATNAVVQVADAPREVLGEAEPQQRPMPAATPPQASPEPHAVAPAAAAASRAAAPVVVPHSPRDHAGPFRASPKTQPIYVDPGLRDPGFVRQGAPAQPPAAAPAPVAVHPPAAAPQQPAHQPPAAAHPQPARAPVADTPPSDIAAVARKQPERTVIHGSGSNYQAVTPEVIAAARAANPSPPPAEAPAEEHAAPQVVTPMPPPQAVQGERVAAAPAQAKPAYARRLQSPVPAPQSDGPPAQRQPAAEPPLQLAAEPRARGKISARQAKMEAELSAADRAKLEANRRAIAAQKRRIETVDYYELLGVARDDSPDAIQAAHARLARKWDPSRVPSVLEDMREEVALIYRQLLEARETLANPQRRNRYDGHRGRPAAATPPRGEAERPRHEPRAKSPERPRSQDPAPRRPVSDFPPSDDGGPRPPSSQAETEMQRAQRSQQRMRDRSALDHVERALAMESDNPNVHALRGYLMAQSAKPEALTDDSEPLRCIARALSLDPDCERAHHFRGMILKRAGRIEEAMESFEVALSLDENNVDAKRELRLYVLRGGRGGPEEAGEQEQKGLLSRFLGRKDP